jgi:hypothetical protein
MSIVMPRYYFDVIDTDGTQTDSEGQQFADLQAANVEALIALLDIAREHLIHHVGGSLHIVIRDEHDHVVLRNSLRLTQEVTDHQ